MRAHTASPSLSLAELEAFDPGSGSGDERRHLCPLCGPDHRQDAAHRALAVNVATGAWLCHRCGASGLLAEHQTHRPRVTARAIVARHRDTLARSPEPPSGPSPWRHLHLEPLINSPGEAYLASRGLPIPLPPNAEVRWCAAFGPHGGRVRPAVVFAIRGEGGRLVAVHARFVDRVMPKCRSLGPVSHGLFVAPGALEAAVLVVTEAPVDALAMAAAGVPAVATCGSRGSWPAWLALAGRTVILAQDADAAGDRQAVALATAAAKAGATVFRLRPPVKDWALAIEQGGWPALREALVSAVGAGEAPEPSAAPEAPAGAAVDLCRACGVPVRGHDHWHHGWICRRCWPAVAGGIGHVATDTTTLSDADREALVAWGLTIGRCATCGQEDVLPGAKPTRRCRMTHRCTGTVRQEG